jgi:hypothetical protein
VQHHARVVSLERIVPQSIKANLSEPQAASVSDNSGCLFVGKLAKTSVEIEQKNKTCAAVFEAPVQIMQQDRYYWVRGI